MGQMVFISLLTISDHRPCYARRKDRTRVKVGADLQSWTKLVAKGHKLYAQLPLPPKSIFKSCYSLNSTLIVGGGVK